MEGLSRLEIQVVPGASADHPRVVLLVDGRDVLAERGHRGLEPESLLHRGDPLIPMSPPRRVVLYHCGCGVAGCSGRACVISESDGVVRWSGFRRFVGSLAAGTQRWNELGFEFRSAWLWSDEEEIYAINLRRQGDQLLIGLRAEPGPDEEAVVNAMAANVLAGDEHTWFVIYDQRRPSLPADPP